MDNREIMDNNILNLEGIKGICLIMSGSEYLQDDEQYGLSFLSNAINEVVKQLKNMQKSENKRVYDDCSAKKEELHDMIEKIKNPDYLLKIYYYTLAKYRRENNSKLL